MEEEEVDAARVEGMIHHVFFPRKLPSVQGKDFISDESHLLHLITKIVRETGKTIGIPAEVVKLFDTCSSLQNGDGLDSSSIQEAILKLDVGDMLALYIRQQNTGLLISMPKNGEDDQAIFSTFPASLPNSTITSSPALIAMEFPEQSISIPFSHVISSTTFCEQLSILYSQHLPMSMAETKKSLQTMSDTRNVPDTMFVSKWITASLSNRDSRICSRNEFPRILKKIRDEVLLDKKTGDLSIPFRRSGFWMTIKVILQISLIRHMGEAEGQFLYKLILIEMMRQISRFMAHGQIDMDLTMQMLAKMGRRLEKLSEKKDIISSDLLKNFHNDIHKKVSDIIVLLRKQIDNQYSKIEDQDKASCELKPLMDLNFAQDIKHSAYKLTRYIQSRTTGNKSGHLIYFPKKRNIARHGLNIESFPLIEDLFSVSSTDEVKMGIVLFDLENWIFKNLNPTMTIDFDEMRSLAIKYSEKALEYYKDDPLGVSRMVLALLKIIRVMDQNVCHNQTYAILKEHASGINTDIVTDLLLPVKYEMDLVRELVSYFNERNSSGNYPSLIGQEEVTENSFSSRFAALSSEMCEKRDRIIANGEVKVEQKRNDIATQKVQITELKRQLSLIPEHTYETRTNWRGRTFTNHNNRWSTCRKCQLEKSIDNCTVYVYERPLREEVHYQNAVVFELMLPKEIACLRDVLFVFRKTFRGTKPTSSSVTTLGYGYGNGSQSQNAYIAETWVENSELTYARTSQHSMLVHLGSSKKLFSHTHLNKQHADSPEDRIILKNSGSCTFYGKENNNNVKLISSVNVKSKCTFKVEENSPYKSMQWALTSTDPMENHALANQSQCPPSITFSEFIEFGSLRSGHRLQLRNIYRALITGNLSFKAESVVSLISQCLWEYGPNGEAHQEIETNTEFVMELGEGLSAFKESQRNNWKHPFNLLNVILITLRVLELTSDEICFQKFNELLMSCRDVVMEWFEKVENVIQLAVSKDQSNVENLRNILVDVGICGAFTFGLNLNSRGRSTELPSSALKSWLLSIIKIESNSKEPSVFRRNLLRSVRNIGLNIEDKSYELAEYNNQEFLNDFYTELWSSSGANSRGTDSLWEKMGQVYYKKVEDGNGDIYYIEVDFISGQFLVNGFSISRLPQEITSHQIFERVFQKTIFEVQPDGYDTFVTVSKYNGSKYSFQLNESSNMLIITELCENGDRYELMPHTFLENELPHLLIVDYCHWWNRKERVIQFRPISQLLHVSTHQVHYVLNLESMELRENGTGTGGRYLVDIASESYRQISTFLAGLELGKYLNIFIDKDNPDHAIVELPRMNLKFRAERLNDNDTSKTYRLVSLEYEDMYVCSQLKPNGVFLGLRNGLLLQDSNEDKKFLIPFGKVEICALRGYQNVHICQNELRRPSYFAYPVDEKFCQFKMGKANASRFYLAYLHAVTSTAVEDPFTGMTGTEKALQILQSEYCWSSEPYDEESLEIMNQIKSLSPKRTHYDHGNIKSLVTVSWPTFTNITRAAHELFDLIITRLIEDSNQLKFLNNINKENGSSSKTTKYTNTGLNIKSYYRHLCYNSNLKVSEFFLKNDRLEHICQKYRGYIEEKRRFSSDDTKRIKSVLHVEKSFKRLVSENLEVISSQDKKGDSISYSLENMRIIADLVNEWKFSLESNKVEKELRELLMTGTQLSGISSGVEFSLSRIDEWMEMDFKNTWINLYNFGRVAREKNMTSEWTLLMTAMTFKGVNLDDLLTLHAIALNPEKFVNLNPPNIPSYENPTEEFTRIKMSNVLKSYESGIENFLLSNNCKKPVSCYSFSEEYKEYQAKRTELTEQYEASRNEEIESLTSKLEEKWTSKSSENFNSIYVTTGSLIKLNEARPMINNLIQQWNNNRELREFLAEVSLRLNNIQRVNIVKPKEWECIIGKAEQQLYQLPRFEINFEKKLIQCFRKRTVSNLIAEEVFQSGKFPCPDDCAFKSDVTASNVNIDILMARQKFYKGQSKEHWDYLKTHLKGQADTHLVLSGLYPRIVPTTMMSRIIPNRSLVHSPNTNSEMALKDFIGGVGVLWVLEQQATRMVKFAKKRSLMENSLRRELETIAEEKDWSPRDKPEWLIFELEQNLMIRRIQVAIANRMMDPPKERKGKHCVMQLNMGEGKTSVILPLIAATLSDGNQLCRITVLQPLFKTNLSSLREVLGGILHRRVYTLPCARNFNFGKSESESILEAYKTAQKSKGIVVTIPEYRLSAQLKLYDAGGKDSGSETAKVLMDIHRWLNLNVRDVLDESDEILSAKYQLIYTQGKQSPPGGGELRWTIVQDLFKRIPLKMYQLWIRNQSGSKKEEIEFDVNFKNQNGTQIFWPCRFLSPKLYPELVNELADDFLDGKTSIKFIQLNSKDRTIVKDFIRNIKVDDKTHHAALRLCGGNEKLQNTILILAGLFKYEVLRLVLSKRWRVNYGVNATGRLKMAVPFKAKDVAAEMTEFGHPDVAVCLTHLSYYYSGLSYAHFKECFEILDSSLKASEIYDGWISKIALPTQVPDSMKNYESVNLHDAKNRDDLYALLKLNMYVIDFWLSKTVLRREFRQYESKMMCTAFDLCSEDLKLVTGFSGTNDSKALLPTPMSQEDLKELENTNEEVRQSLLSPENNYEALPANVSGRMILDELVENQIPVLLDAGALMLELNNEEVAREWLKRINYKRKIINEMGEHVEIEIEGAVYFNKIHVLMVMDRQKQIREFESSPFTERLDRCVVYLDDAHTRGTDLKFPKNTRACVTLTGGITRDKTVQACMRMRMLGKGHFISFFASQEAHNGIRDYCFGSEAHTDIEVTTEHVSKWIQKNSDVFVEDGLVHWASAACNYALKRASHLHLATPKYSILTRENLKDLSTRCSDKEVIELMDYYGKVKKKCRSSKLSKINSSLF